MVAMKTTQVGHTVRLELPYSEVCMHLRLAGTVRAVRVLEAGVQILNEDGSPYSFPITHGEAGLLRRDMPGGVYGEEPDATFWYAPAECPATQRKQGPAASVEAASRWQGRTT